MNTLIFKVAHAKAGRFAVHPHVWIRCYRLIRDFVVTEELSGVFITDQGIRQTVLTYSLSAEPIFSGRDVRKAPLLSACDRFVWGQSFSVLPTKVTPAQILAMKGREPIAALTAYDYPLARLLDEADIPFLHVGDTVGMVVLGYPDTTHVTMAEMEHHIRAVARAQPRGLIAADLPFRTYDTPADAVTNAQRLIAAGAEAVKAEGGREILAQVQAIVQAGIPYCGHLGMLPQHVREEGGYRIKGKTASQRESLLADSHVLADAGAFAVVLEIVTATVAREITQSIPIPTIGIGSGQDCDGQILVTHDLLGLFPWFTPRFVRPKLAAAELIRSAVREWKDELPGRP